MQLCGGRGRGAGFCKFSQFMYSAGMGVIIIEFIADLESIFPYTVLFNYFRESVQLVRISFSLWYNMIFGNRLTVKNG